MTSHAPSAQPLSLDKTHLVPGLRLAIGLSGGADSVALTRALAEAAPSLGLVLSIAHLHHGLRSEEADEDQAFCAALARSLDLPFHVARVDTCAEARKETRHPSGPEDPGGNESGRHESLEQAARRLRYQWFRQLMRDHSLDAVATAHTLDDQAETVLAKILRGAWTEGLSAIHPVVLYPEGKILRPLLEARRHQVESYLNSLHQPWRTDSSNADLSFTRNRIRHHLLPELEKFNPQVRQSLTQMATLARDEESFWAAEVARVAPQVLLSGRPVRGGGRAAAESLVAIDIVRLNAQPLALRRRLLREAASRLNRTPQPGSSPAHPPSSALLDFQATDSLLHLAAHGRSGQKLNLPGPLTAERTPRELRLTPGNSTPSPDAGEQFLLPIPGHLQALGTHFTSTLVSPELSALVPAVLRPWRPGDRVTLRHSSGPRKVKEVLDRLKISGPDRPHWPVLEWQGEILWMKGVTLHPHPRIVLTVRDLSPAP